MIRKIRVYVAGPFSTGADYYHTCQNVKAAIDMGDELLDLGYAPYVPHLNHYWHLQYNHTWEQWMEMDKAWVLASDVLLRLPGDSRGADQEVAWADDAAIPVVHSIKELTAWSAMTQASKKSCCVSSLNY